MKVHSIGHASLFIETQDCKILMDPILWESHCEGIEDICPQRQVIHKQIPEFDILVISHQHTDHFDIRSLANLPKHVDVLIPKDKFMEDCLRRLGYYNIYSLKDFHEVRIGSTSLITTHSENRVPEFGMVFADSNGVFWNQVDSVVSSQTISKIKSDYPQIDFLLASWQPMLETKYQFNQNLNFPYKHYNDVLNKINLSVPKSIAPGANGFKLINGSAWLNKIVFPVTREQFCEDVKQAAPYIGENIFIFDPGDIITLENGEVNYSSQASSFVKKVMDDSDSIYFSPVTTDGTLVDDNPEQYDIEEMRDVISYEVNTNLSQFFQDKKDSIFMEYCHWKVIFQLEVVFPHDSETWYFDFCEGTIQSHKGKNPLSNVFSYITASAFYGLLQGFKGWDWANMGGYYRCFNKVYQATSHGIIQPLLESADGYPLSFKYPYKEAYEKARNFEIKKWGQTIEEPDMNKKMDNPMVAIGKTLTKLPKKDILVYN